jgi:hypothetical protein
LTSDEPKGENLWALAQAEIMQKAYFRLSPSSVPLIDINNYVLFFLGGKKKDDGPYESGLVGHSV